MTDNNKVVVELGQVAKERGIYTAGNKYYKDNIVEYMGAAYIAEPATPNGYVTVAPWTTDRSTLNTGWRVFADGNPGYVEEIADECVRQVNEAIDAYQPIVVEGDVSNAPDEEDLTSVNVGGTDVIKFKDKAYAPAAYSGMGRVYLRKNIVDGVNTLTRSMINKANTIYIIQYDFDLVGETVTIPENCILDFYGGSMRNGTLVGNSTLIKAEPTLIFNSNITIRGTWNIKDIYDDWFVGNDNNAIDNVVALTNANINNIVHLNKANYYYDADNNGEARNKFMIIKSNTHVINKATINVLPNALTKYSVISMRNVNNIIFEGGKLIGDVETHTGTTGEWGVGVDIRSCSNIIVRNVTSFDMWGDGFFIGVDSDDNVVHNENIYLCNVTARYNRRQGISIIDGEVIIKESTFIDTGVKKWTSPGANMDLEPNNANEFIKLKMSNCTVANDDIISNGMLIAIWDNIETDISNCRVGNVSISCNTQHCYFFDCILGNVSLSKQYNSNTDITLTRCSLRTVVNSYSGTGAKQKIKLVDCFASNIDVMSASVLIEAIGGYLNNVPAMYSDGISLPAVVGDTVPQYVNGGTFKASYRNSFDGWVTLENGKALKIRLINYTYTTKVTIYDFDSGILSNSLFYTYYGMAPVVMWTKFFKKGSSTYRSQENSIISDSLLEGNVLVSNPLRDGSITFHIGKPSGTSNFYYRVDFVGFANSMTRPVPSVTEVDATNVQWQQYFGIEGNVRIADIASPKIPFANVAGNAYYNSAYEHIIIGAARKSGTTAQRPTNVSVGFQYLDTSLSPARPIWWNGTAWVDATGTTV